MGKGARRVFRAIFDFFGAVSTSEAQLEKPADI